jgi:hypothetical protein
MNTTQAVETLIREANSKRLSRSAYKRVLRALNALDADGSLNRARILYMLEYANAMGTPWPWLFTDKPTRHSPMSAELESR